MSIRISAAHERNKNMNVLDFVAVRCQFVLEIHQDSSVGENEAHVHVGILNTDALVRTAAEDKVVLRVSIGRAVGIQPTFWV